MNGGRAERERETQNQKQAPGSEPSAQSLTRARTHGPRDLDLAEVGRLTDCATQAPQGLCENIFQEYILRRELLGHRTISITFLRGAYKFQLICIFVNIWYSQGAWAAQLIKHLTWAQVMISWLSSSSPTSGSVLTAQPGACFRFCVFPSLCSLPAVCAHTRVFSLSQTF